MKHYTFKIEFENGGVEIVYAIGLLSAVIQAYANRIKNGLNLNSTRAVCMETGKVEKLQHNFLVFDIVSVEH